MCTSLHRRVSVRLHNTRVKAIKTYYFTAIVSQLHPTLNLAHHIFKCIAVVLSYFLRIAHYIIVIPTFIINPLNPELNPVCYLLALLAHHFLHVSRIRVKSLTLRLLMSYIYIYIYMEHLFLMFLDHTQRRSTVGRTPLDE